MQDMLGPVGGCDFPRQQSPRALHQRPGACADAAHPQQQMLNDLEFGVVPVKVRLAQQQYTRNPGRCDGAQRLRQCGQRCIARQQAAEQAAEEEGRCQ